MDRDGTGVWVPFLRKGVLMGQLKILKRCRRKKSLFFRLFFSIMAVTLIILFVQTVELVLMLRHQSHQFAEEAFTDYENRLDDILEFSLHEGEAWDLERVKPVLWMAADDRILSLVLKDPQDNALFILENTHKGVTADEAPFLIPSSDTVVHELSTPSEVSVSQDVRVVPDRSRRPLPDHEVIGAIPLYSGGESGNLIGSVEVMVLDPIAYAMKALLIRKIINAFVITIPVALVIAFIGSQLIAFAVSRHARRIARSLEELAGGKAKAEHVPSTIKELTQIEESVETLRKRLNAHERMRQQWLKGIAHDLNTPVTSLKISAESALDGVVPLDRTLIERMNGEIEELEKRIVSVMTLSSMEAPDFHVTYEEINLLDFVDDVFSSLSCSKKIVMDIGIERMEGDRRLLLLVAREAVTNACKYGTDDVPVKWSIHTEEDSKDVTMTFTNGGSLSEEACEHLFDPWYRADESRSKSGSGMGLSIIRQIMESHGGTASFRQENGLVTLSLRWPQSGR